MTPLLKTVFTWIGGYRPPHPDLIPREIRMHPGDVYALRLDMGLYPQNDSAVLGLRMTPDEHLPRGVWRVCADDQRLIHDSRSGDTL